MPSSADPVYCKEQPDLWGVKLDEQEKRKSVQKLLSEPLPCGAPSPGLDRYGQWRAAEEAPGKPGGWSPVGRQLDQAREGARTAAFPSTPSLPLAASSSSSSPSSERLRGHVVLYQRANPYSKLLAGCFLSKRPSKGEKKWGF